MAYNSTHATDTPMESDIATPAHQNDSEEAFPGLPNHVAIQHILRSEYFDDPADLARLPAVSRAIRDTIAETGLQFKELDENAAVRLGCLSAVQRQQRAGLLSRRELLCQAAERSGQLEKLKLLRENDAPWDEATCTGGARGGHLEVLQWARANGCPWDSWSCAWAAKRGHFETLRWARTNGCPWDKKTCSYAAENGHLEMLKWAHTHGCQWDAETCLWAAYGGYLEVLQLARANGCPWDCGMCSGVAMGRHLGVLQWAIENGCPCDWNRRMSLATGNEDLDESERLVVLAWLNMNKAP